MEDNGSMVNAEILKDNESIDFRPQLFWQEVRPFHQIKYAGLDIKMNFSTGVNQARFVSTVNIEDGSPEAQARVLSGATTIVPKESRIDRRDEDKVSTMITAAATWGKEEEIEYMLRSCYVTEDAALPALSEAAFRGFENCLRVLIKAGVSAWKCSPSSLSSEKNALHVACESGNEKIAKILIDSMPSREKVELVDGNGNTAFDLLRRNDLEGMARRLETFTTEKFGD